jgi:hypothetical protein
MIFSKCGLIQQNKTFDTSLRKINIDKTNRTNLRKTFRITYIRTMRVSIILGAILPIVKASKTNF